jgi:hypothetical protein
MNRLEGEMATHTCTVGLIAGDQRVGAGTCSTAARGCQSQQDVHSEVKDLSQLQQDLSAKTSEATVLSQARTADAIVLA